MPLLETKGAGSAQGFGLSLGSAERVYIEDVFSTYLIKPAADFTTYSINNGIDLLGEGGMTWFKARDAAQNNLVYDTVRGSSSGNANALITNGTQAQQTTFFDFVTPNANGFTVNFASGGGQLTNSGINFASWTFRKQPKFFDVVTYTGNGTAGRTVAHNLGSVPGCIIVKVTNTSDNWQVYHRANTNAPATDYLVLNATNATADDDTRWNDTLPTSTTFSLGTSSAVNGSGNTYVAYLFAHDAGGFGLEGTDNVISCGSYTGNGGTLQDVDLGFEPQYLLVKNASAAADWWIVDAMRGFTVAGINGAGLYANRSDAETTQSLWNINATGFTVGAFNNVQGNASGNTYIYMAIRRGPMKVPESGTSVFSANAQTTAAPTTVTTNFPVDMEWWRNSRTTAGRTNYSFDRLRGGTKQLRLNTTDAEQTDVAPYINYFDSNTTFKENFASAGQDAIFWSFRRATGFFDVVCYTGNDTARTLTHNLAAVPELMIVKSRSATGNWSVYVAATTATNVMYLNTTNASFGASGYWNNTAPTASVFTIGNTGDVNNSGTTFVAYLFATVAGVSKVGSYTGTGTTQVINCGFTAGARFVMIKRTDSTGDWYVWDSARGIVAGNDPHLSLNTTAAEVTTDDSVDTDSTGFVVNQLAATNINVTSASYIYLAVS